MVGPYFYTQIENHLRSEPEITRKPLINVDPVCSSRKYTFSSKLQIKVEVHEGHSLIKLCHALPYGVEACAKLEAVWQP